MPKAADLIEAVKAKEGITTNYRLAQITGIPENRLSDYAKGKRMPDAYAATRLALALDREPIEVIAELEAESETNEKKREFWRNFLTRAACTIASAVALSFGFPSSSAANPLGQANSHATEDQIMRTVRRWLNACARRTRRFFGTPISGVIATAA